MRETQKWLAGIVAILLSAAIVGWVSSVEALKEKVQDQNEVLIRIDGRTERIEKAMEGKSKQ